MEKTNKMLRLNACLRLLLGIVTLCSFSEMMATQFVRNLPTQTRFSSWETKQHAIQMRKIMRERKKNFDPLNNQIALLRELCDTAGLKAEIGKYPLEKLVDLRNFTAQQGFSELGDSCYVTIDQLLDDQLLTEAKSWLKKLMAKKNNFFNTKDYNQFQRLNEFVGEKILKEIWNDEDIRPELLKELYPKSLSLSIDFIKGFASGKKLIPFLDKVKKMYIDTFHIIHDEQSLAIVQKMDQNRLHKELADQEKAKKSWWYSFLRWLYQ